MRWGHQARPRYPNGDRNRNRSSPRDPDLCYGHPNISGYHVVVTTTQVEYENNYYRDSAGVWRYRVTGAPVPRARDLLLMDRFAPSRTRSDEHGWALFDRPTALTDPDLNWVLEDVPHANRQEAFPGKLGVPWPEWERRAHKVVGMLAPELHPQNLLSADMVARLAGLSTASLMEYVRRGACPGPTVRQTRCLFWTQPIVANWLANRKRRGQVATTMGNPQYMVRIDGATGRTAFQVGKIPSSPWCLVVTTDTNEPMMVDLTEAPLLSEQVDSPFRLVPDKSRTRVLARDGEGHYIDVPRVGEVIAAWVAQHVPGQEPDLVP